MSNHSLSLPVTQATFDEIARRIVEHFSPERIVLFGSYAYGEPTPDSDIDLLVIMKSKERSNARRVAISRALRDREFAMDIVVRTPAEIALSMRRVDPFIHEALRKGITLYERHKGSRRVVRQSRKRPQSRAVPHAQEK